VGVVAQLTPPSASDQYFLDLVADLRAETAGGRHKFVRSQLPFLESQASNVRQRGQLATLEVVTGAALADWTLHQSGIDRLRGSSSEDLLLALENINDLSVLGPAAMRRGLVREAVLAESSDLLDLLESTKPADLSRLASQLDTSVLRQSLQRDLRNWLAWRALDLLLETRDNNFAQLMQTLTATPSNAPGAWELQAVVAVGMLVRGKSAKAARVLSRLFEQNSDSPVRVRILQHVFLRYGVFGINDDQFKELYREYQSDRDALPDLLGAVTHSLLVAHSRRERSQALERVKDCVLPPWFWFPLFVGSQVPPVETRQLEQLLMRNAPDPQQWFWPGHTSAFVVRVSQLPVSQRLKTLAIARDLTGDPTAERGIETCLADAPVSELVATWRAGHLDWLDPAMLPLPRQKTWRRGGVYRVIIDGNNVGCGGTSDPVAQLSRVTTAVAELRDAGFEDIHIFFDVHRRAWSPKDWTEIHRLQDSNIATICDGKADPSVIRCFLEQPQVSWIVGRDRYRDHLTDFPELRKWWPERRLGFEFVRGQLRWRSPLDRPLERR
jgi:hypothetical protein